MVTSKLLNDASRVLSGDVSVFDYSKTTTLSRTFCSTKLPNWFVIRLNS